MYAITVDTHSTERALQWEQVADPVAGPGDVIVEISQDDVRAPKDVVARVKKAQEDGRKSVLMLVEGQSGLRFVALQLAAKK